MATRMVREPNLDVTNPALDDVKQVMALVLSDEEEQCLELDFEKPGDGQASSVSRLLVIRVNDCKTGSPLGWVVDYSTHAGKDAKVLALTNRPACARRTVEFFGALESVREDCILDQTPVLEAVQYFLRSGEANPAQVWLRYFDAVVAL